MTETFWFVSENDPNYADYRARFLNILNWDGIDLSGGSLDPGNLAAFGEAQMFFGGGSGLVSSITDWSSFAEALLKNFQGLPASDGAVLLSSSTLEYASQPHISYDQGSGIEYWGLGFGTDAGSDTRVGGRSISFRWGGASGTQFAVLPDLNVRKGCENEGGGCCRRRGHL